MMEIDPDYRVVLVVFLRGEINFNLRSNYQYISSSLNITANIVQTSKEVLCNLFKALWVASKRQEAEGRGQEEIKGEGGRGIKYNIIFIKLLSSFFYL
jgi:hypothetical protein